jgi:hypothetical protein
MRLIRCTLTVATGFSLLLANTPWLWKLLALACFGLMVAIIYFQIQRLASIRLLRLYWDGAITLVLENCVEIPAALKDGAWSSPWVSVLRISRLDTWSMERLVISRSRNRPDSYRQMLKLLRFGIQAKSGDNIMQQP